MIRNSSRPWFWVVTNPAKTALFTDEERPKVFFENARERYAGRDVYVGGVPAYSTLGYSNWLGGDPLLSTFVSGSVRSPAMRACASSRRRTIGRS